MDSKRCPCTKKAHPIHSIASITNPLSTPYNPSTSTASCSSSQQPATQASNSYHHHPSTHTRHEPTLPKHMTTLDASPETRQSHTKSQFKPGARSLRVSLQDGFRDLLHQASHSHVGQVMNDKWRWTQTNNIIHIDVHHHHIRTLLHHHLRVSRVVLKKERKATSFATFVSCQNETISFGFCFCSCQARQRGRSVIDDGGWAGWLAKRLRQYSSRFLDLTHVYKCVCACVGGNLRPSHRRLFHSSLSLWCQLSSSGQRHAYRHPKE